MVTAIDAMQQTALVRFRSALSIALPSQLLGAFERCGSPLCH
jgi:hypothetical protein